jgi:molecular chaperone Hsp33
MFLRMTAAPRVSDDHVQPFQIDASALRGRIVRLGPLADTIISRHDYPEPVAVLLAEAITLAVLLSGMLKYDGVFTLQTKGDGPVNLLVADVTTAGAVRGYAQFDAERLATISGATTADGASVPKLLGAGYLAFTVDQGEHTDRYQGIVELQGATLAECAHHYFRQSEQVQADIKVAVGQIYEQGARRPAWRAGGIMIQRLPDAGGTAGRGSVEEQEDGWRRAMILMGSSTAAELLDPDLPLNDLLFRLFHEDGVRVYRPHPVVPQCRCSRERIERILGAMDPADRDDMTVEGRIVVTCEFCNAEYVFDGGSA